MHSEILLIEYPLQVLRSMNHLCMISGSFEVGPIFQLNYSAFRAPESFYLVIFGENGNRTWMSLVITQSFTFLIPSLVFAWIVFKKNLWSFFGFKNQLRTKWIFLSIILLFFLLPIIQVSYELNQSLPLPEWMKGMGLNIAERLEPIIRMNDPFDLLLGILVIALLPALGEELLFRGILQQFGYQVFKRPLVSVMFTAIIFSVIHFQFEGFIPRFILGLYLGYLFLWTNNLLVPIIAHFIYNAFIMVLSYLSQEMSTGVDKSIMPEIPWYLATISAFCIVPLAIYFRNICFNSVDSNKKTDL